MRKRRPTDAEVYGRLSVEGKIIRNRSAWYGDWEIPLADVKLISEETTSLGPFGPDWELCFYRANGERVCASMYQENHMVLDQLEAILGFTRKGDLVGSAGNASLIHYPQSLSGDRVHDYAERYPRWLPRWLRFVWPPRTEAVFTPQMRRFFCIEHDDGSMG